MSNDKQLIVFAKSPLPGHCKTRLSPLLGDIKACEFYKSLLSGCFKTISALSNTDISIHIYPDTNNSFLSQLNKKYAYEFLPQRGDNLGERMFLAIRQSLNKYSKVVLIGSDCPAIDKNYIEAAFHRLKTHDIVFGPATDGGYVLIGANKLDKRIFSNIPWSTDQVLEQSLNQSTSAGYNAGLLQALRDIDTPDDYLYYQAQIANQTFLNFKTNINSGARSGSSTG